ncbi:MAG TPA: hypothetical protein VNW90_25325 [Acetobacteraceae bacterium]|jgi:hypothetical protein|nr:hypothetical protein [Acetobacteraceae bacterium]
MPSTYTPNLGIELPATGEQANTWGLTINRNMDTLDTAINGNVHLALSTSPYQLTINNGADAPVAANPVIIWTGAQTAQGVVQIDWQSNRKHFYCMSNQTSGGFGIAFAQGSGTQFVLQAGYDALLYSDGGGAGANVAAALASPQFTNLLATGAARVLGALTVAGSINGIISTDVPGNVHLTGGLGVGNPTAIPDPVTILGIGSGQLRLVYGNYGVIFRNDGATFYLMFTASGDPYGSYSAPYPIQIDLASRCVGLAGWGPSTSYGLSVPSIHASSIAADGAISAGGVINAAGGFNNTAGRSYFKSGDPYNIGLEYGSFVNWIGTNASNQFQLARADGTVLFAVDQSGNAALTGGLHVLAGGVQFPDGTIQTTATSSSFPGNITVTGAIYGPASTQQSAMLHCPPYTVDLSGVPNSLFFSYNAANNWVTLWVTLSDGSTRHVNVVFVVG